MSEKQQKELQKCYEMMNESFEDYKKKVKAYKRKKALLIIGGIIAAGAIGFLVGRYVEELDMHNIIFDSIKNYKHMQLEHPITHEPLCIREDIIYTF